MRIYWYWINASLLVLVTLTVWLLWSASHPHGIDSDKNPHETDAYMKHVNSVQFDAAGKPKYRLISPQMNHHAYRNTTDMQTPHFTIYSENTGAPWDITAPNGEAIHGAESIHLWGGVKIHREHSSINKATTLLTSEGMYYLDTHLAETDQPVTILQPGTKIDAIGMQAYLDKSIINLLSDVKGQYDPTVKAS